VSANTETSPQNTVESREMRSNEWELTLPLKFLMDIGFITTQFSAVCEPTATRIIIRLNSNYYKIHSQIKRGGQWCILHE
jgi:hypothetical protein